MKTLKKEDKRASRQAGRRNSGRFCFLRSMIGIFHSKRHVGCVAVNERSRPNGFLYRSQTKVVVINA